MSTKTKKPAKPTEHSDATERDTVSKFLLRAQMSDIKPADVKAYTTILFAPADTSPAQKKKFGNALFKFAALGWTFYHAAHERKTATTKAK